MIKLVKMSPEVFALWNERIWVLYREELIRSGTSESAADKNVESNVAETMPGGVLSSGQFVFEVFDDDTHVGNVWLAQNESEWFIYDIDIDEPYRGKGLGRATMRAIEDHVRSLGGSEIGLSVFGFNTIAQKLYLSEGYTTTRMSMSKELL
jgi:ribosomal protein S18 acetylase RimI-like enzyme